MSYKQPWALLVTSMVMFTLPTLRVYADYELGPLNPLYYAESCPNLTSIVMQDVIRAVSGDTGAAASLLYLHYSDCIVNGCDGSILLDDTNTMKGEKNAPPNRGVRGYDVVYDIKADVEKACPGTVSCTDILALAAQQAVAIMGGPVWPLAFGRRDTLTARESDTWQAPGSNEPLDKIVSKFTSKGFNLSDVVALSGAHTIGHAHCFSIKDRLYNNTGSGKPDPFIEPTLEASLRYTCPNPDGSDNKSAPLDRVTPVVFDNKYYANLVARAGVLPSDQALVDGNATTAALVLGYIRFPRLFLADFVVGMTKMSNLGVLTGSKGEIRKNCWVVNGKDW